MSAKLQGSYKEYLIAKHHPTEAIYRGLGGIACKGAIQALADRFAAFGILVEPGITAVTRDSQQAGFRFEQSAE